MSRKCLGICPDPHMIRLFQMNMQRARWEVRTAPDIQEAWDILMKERVDLIVMDPSVPDYEAFIRQVEEEPITGAVRVIVLGDRWQRSHQAIEALKKEMEMTERPDRQPFALPGGFLVPGQNNPFPDMKLISCVLAGIAGLLLLAWVWSAWAYR